MLVTQIGLPAQHKEVGCLAPSQRRGDVTVHTVDLLYPFGKGITMGLRAVLLE